ncbi:BDH-like protein [Mya arenaria]|uniref:BDH-like protein n=1 Tax=Mya arenaria TaxID=6604 RepID=A0ABY7DGR7_MYAAR|nr:BDH-like protein [Mya arenaria]
MLELWAGFGHQIALRLHNQGFTVFAGCLFPQGDGARAFRDRKCARLQVLHLDVTKDDHVKEALKAIKKKLPANGRIINVTSVKGRIALPSDVAYTTTKWAGEAFSDILRREMYRFGIRVVLIEPGNFGGITGMLNTETMEATLEECWTLASDEVKEAYGREYINQQVAGLKASGSTSAPEVEPVVDAMQEAVCNTSPEYRYLIHGSSKPLDWYCLCPMFFYQNASVQDLRGVLSLITEQGACTVYDHTVILVHIVRQGHRDEPIILNVPVGVPGELILTDVYLEKQI